MLMIHVIVVTYIDMSDLPDIYAQSPRAYISGKSLVPMLQLICNIAPGELKSAPARNLRSKITSIFIGKLTRIDCGL